MNEGGFLPPSEPPAPEKREKQELSEAQAVRFVYNAMRLTQNTNLASQALYQWLRYSDYHLPTQSIQPVVDTLVSSLNQLIAKNRHVSLEQDDIKSVFDHEVTTMATILNLDKALFEPVRIVDMVATTTIEQDYYYLCKRGGRPRPLQEEGSSILSSLDDPFYSFICVYVLLGKSTGIQEYDQLFQSIRTYLHEGKGERGLGIRLVEIVKVYNQYHQEQAEWPIPPRR